MVLDQNYINLKYQVIKAERRVLKELGFCVHVKHPHKVILNVNIIFLKCSDNCIVIDILMFFSQLIVLYLQVLGLETNKKLMQLAW